MTSKALQNFYKAYSKYALDIASGKLKRRNGLRLGPSVMCEKCDVDGIRGVYVSEEYTVAIIPEEFITPEIDALCKSRECSLIGKTLKDMDFQIRPADYIGVVEDDTVKTDILEYRTASNEPVYFRKDLLHKFPKNAQLFPAGPTKPCLVMSIEGPLGYIMPTRRLK